MDKGASGWGPAHEIAFHGEVGAPRCQGGRGRHLPLGNRVKERRDAVLRRDCTGGGMVGVRTMQLSGRQSSSALRK